LLSVSKLDVFGPFAKVVGVEEIRLFLFIKPTDEVERLARFSRP